MNYSIYSGLSIVIILFTAGLYYYDDHIFQRFTGNINPFIASLFIIFSGIVSLSFLHHRNWFAVYKKKSGRSTLRLSGLALFFIPVSIFIDIKVGFPAEMNIHFPASLLFYPVIGFYVEILFHVLPLTILLSVLTSISGSINHNKLVWFCILVVSLPEPVYQTIPMFSTLHYPFWSAALVFLNIFLFNFFQLFIFKQYDFISMYSFRLMYYLGWHIVWGYLRLGVLF